MPPEQLVDHTFLMPPDADGTRCKAKIVKMIDDHLTKNDFQLQPERIQFNCLVNDQFKEIVTNCTIIGCLAFMFAPFKATVIESSVSTAACPSSSMASSASKLRNQTIASSLKRDLTGSACATLAHKSASLKMAHHGWQISHHDIGRGCQCHAQSC